METIKLNLETYHTGGGCMALKLDLKGEYGGYFLITCEDGEGIPEPGDLSSLGLYDEEGHQLFSWYFPNRTFAEEFIRDVITGGYDCTRYLNQEEWLGKESTNDQADTLSRVAERLRARGINASYKYPGYLETYCPHVTLPQASHIDFGFANGPLGWNYSRPDGIRV